MWNLYLFINTLFVFYYYNNIHHLTASNSSNLAVVDPFDVMFDGYSLFLKLEQNLVHSKNQKHIIEGMSRLSPSPKHYNYINRIIYTIIEENPAAYRGG